MTAMKKRIFTDITERLRTFFANSSMTTQFVLPYLMLVTLPAVVFILFSYHLSEERIQRSLLKSADETVVQVASNLSFQFQLMVNVGQTIASSSEVRMIMDRPPVQVIEDYHDAESIRRVFSEMSIVSQGLKLRMYVDEFKLYAREGVNFFPKDDFLRSHDVTEKGYLLPDAMWKYEPAQGHWPSRVTYSVPVYGRRDVTKVNAYVQVGMDYSRLESLLASPELSTRASFWVLDSGGLTVLSHGSSDCPELSPEELEKSSGVVELESGNYAFARVQTSGWYLVYLVEAGSLQDSGGYLQLLLTMLTMIIAFAIFFLVVILAMILIITNYYDKRLQSIAMSLRLPDISQGEVTVYDKTSNLNLLANNTGKLILKVRELTEQSMQDKLKAQMAELKALQWQINPHFLYNALDTVNWAAIKRGDQDTSRIISLIARYFRLVLSGGNSNVTLEQELEFCQVYLQIQTEIDPGRFTFKIDSDRGLRPVVLPKMTVQPFVENALIHGVMKLRNRPGEMLVSVSQTDVNTIIKVSDNGYGFDTNRIIEGNSSEGFGIQNVLDRLKLFLECPPEINYISDSSGTTVELIIRL